MAERIEATQYSDFPTSICILFARIFDEQRRLQRANNVQALLEATIRHLAAIAWSKAVDAQAAPSRSQRRILNELQRAGHNDAWLEILLHSSSCLSSDPTPWVLSLQRALTLRFDGCIPATRAIYRVCKLKQPSAFPPSLADFFRAFQKLRNERAHNALPNEQVEQLEPFLIDAIDALLLRSPLENVLRLPIVIPKSLSHEGEHFRLSGLLLRGEVPSEWSGITQENANNSLGAPAVAEMDGIQVRRLLPLAPYVVYTARRLRYLTNVDRGAGTYIDYSDTETDRKWRDPSFANKISFFLSNIPESTEGDFHTSGVTIHNLPRRTGEPFVGRDAEREEIQSLLLDEKVHIIVMDGIGGIGKTALSLDICNKIVEKSDRFDFVLWVSAKADYLMPGESILRVEQRMRGMRDLLRTIAIAIGYSREEAECPRQAQLLKYMGSAHFLIVVDNFETVSGAEAMWQLFLSLPPTCKVLITSRHREIKNKGEYVSSLGGLDPKSARALFGEEVRRLGVRLPADFGDQSILDLIDRLGRVPLAIKHVVGLLARGRHPTDILKALGGRRLDVLLQFCFPASFEGLTHNARLVLYALALASDPLDAVRLRLTLELESDELMKALLELKQVSFLVTTERANGTWYSLLPLTRKFGYAQLQAEPSEISSRLSEALAEIVRLETGDTERIREEATVDLVGLIVNQAKRAAEHGETLAAERLFDKAVALGGETEEPWAERAQYRIGSGKIEAGLADFAQALRFEESRPRLWYLAGQGFAVAGRFDEAARHFRRCIAMNPPETLRSLASYGLGRALTERAKQEIGRASLDDIRKTWQEAEDYLRHALFNRPEDEVQARHNANVCYYLAMALFALEQGVEARSILRRGKAFDPTDERFDLSLR